MVFLLKVVQANTTVIDYIPLGVGVIISPWNFAFAIMAGTTVAALVTGNTVLLKTSIDNTSRCIQIHRST